MIRTAEEIKKEIEEYKDEFDMWQDGLGVFQPIDINDKYQQLKTELEYAKKIEELEDNNVGKPLEGEARSRILKACNNASNVNEALDYINNFKPTGKKKEGIWKDPKADGLPINCDYQLLIWHYGDLEPTYEVIYGIEYHNRKYINKQYIVCADLIKQAGGSNV